MKELWKSFVRGLSSTLGIAQVRRPVPSPEEEFHAASEELREAIAKTRKPYQPD